MSIKYRPEIDGLRAIAVIAVILYHANIVLFGHRILPGGFIGVDIFLVISGYLITSIILRDMETQKFSFANFYERRARRILPALFAVMLVSLPFAWIYILPKGLNEYAGASLSVLGFGSNIWFWLEDSYTAESGYYKPMLHTWTLALEEQFYILFPIILMVIMTFARKYIIGIFLLLFLISLETAELASADYPYATFNLLHTRFWELMAGALLARVHMERGREANYLLRTIMPPIGLFMILHALLSFEGTTRHPSFITLLPVAGTMILIWFCRRGETVSNILSTRIFVWIGLISYSLYLWHYPIFAFARIDMGALSIHMTMACIALTFILATLSYFLIERPLRYHAPLKLFIPLMIISASIIAVTNIYILKTDGAKFRMDAYEGIFGSDEDGKLPDWKKCFEPRPELGKHCKFMQDGAKGTLIGIGDSHLAVLGPTLRALAEKHNFNYEQFPRCVFMKNTEIIKPDNSVEINTCAEEQIAELAKYKNAIIVKTSRLTFRITGTNMPNAEMTELSDQYVIAENNVENEINTIEESIAAANEDILAQGHTLIQIYPMPETSFSADYRLKNLLKGYEMDYKARIKEVAHSEMATSLSDYIHYQKQAFDALDSVAQNPNYYKIYPHKIFCDETLNLCNTILDNRVLYRDINHVSDYGAKLIADQVEEIITD